MKSVTAVIVSTLLAVIAAPATAAVISIDFDGPLTSDLSANTYFEDGFNVTANNTNTAVVAGEMGDGFMNPGDTFFFEKADGGLFTLASFTVGARPNLSEPDAFDLLGFLDGVQVVDYGNFSLPNLFGQMFDGFATTAIDEFRIVGTEARRTAPIWDQFVFETTDVPAPGAIALFGFGLACLGAFARRRKA